MRRPRPETALAAATAAVGVMSVVSALTPSVAARVDLVRGVLPPGLPSAARVVALAFGLALLWISRALALRKRRAWWLAVALVVGVAAAHLAKAFDFEEATASVLLLAALFRFRAAFDAPGDPEVAPALAVTTAAFLLSLSAQSRLEFSDPLERLDAAAATVLAFGALALWLRPLRERVRQTVGERARVRELVRTHGRDSLAFFAMRRDKSYFFASGGGAFVAYRVVGGTALVSGDPVGDGPDVARVLEEFRTFAHSRGWRIAILGAGAPLLPLYRSLGLRALRIGDEAVVRPMEFSLEGRAIRKVRQSVHRARRAGYRVSYVRADEVGTTLRAELDEVSADWLGRWPERGFTMAMDDLYAEPGAVIAAAELDDGRVGAFLHLVPCPASGGYSLGAMRRRRATPNGLMEFLLAETIAWAREAGVAELSLNFCVFANVLRGDRDDAFVRTARFALRRLDRVFQLDRLLSFSRKFAQDWRPRYLCCEGPLDFLPVGLAYLRVESLLTPPRLQPGRRA